MEYKKKILISIFAGIALVIGVIIFLVLENNTEEYDNFEESLESDIQDKMQNSQIEEIEEIVVHISGQVVNEGIIVLQDGARLIDAINKAGGLTEEADISKINLAYVLEDAQKIYIPSIKEKEENVSIFQENNMSQGNAENNTSSNMQKKDNIMVNINTATKEELQQLNGIGSSIATKIVEYRKENGKFNTIEDIKNVSGIGDSKFNKIKNNICVK